MFEIVAGELRAKLGTVSAMRQVRSGHDTCAVAAGPGCGARWLRRGLAGLFTATQRRRCEGRRRVLPQCRWAAAGPGRAIHSDLAPLVWRAPEGPAAVLVGGGGAWPGFETTRRAKLAARTARGRAAAHRHTQRPSPPAPRTPVGHQATKQPRNGNARQPQRAAARSRSQWNTQRSRAATTSATWTAFRAAPLRRLSPETTSTSPRLPSTAWS